MDKIGNLISVPKEPETVQLEDMITQEPIGNDKEYYRIETEELNLPIEKQSALVKIFASLLNNLDKKFQSQRSIVDAVNTHYKGTVLTQPSVCKVFTQLPININYNKEYYQIIKQYNYYMMVKITPPSTISRVMPIKAGVKKTVVEINEDEVKKIKEMINTNVYCRASEDILIIKCKEGKYYYQLIQEIKQLVPEWLLFDVLPEMGENNIKVLLNSAYGRASVDYVNDLIRIIYFDKKEILGQTK